MTTHFMVAVLRMCNTCSCHGKIVLPSGGRSREFCNKEDGVAELDRLLHLGLIDKFEHSWLLQEILHNVFLAETVDDSSDLYLLFCQRMNETKVIVGQDPPVETKGENPDLDDEHGHGHGDGVVH